VNKNARVHFLESFACKNRKKEGEKYQNQRSPKTEWNKSCMRTKNKAREQFFDNRSKQDFLTFKMLNFV
jgi:hypothetical protein